MLNQQIKNYLSAIGKRGGKKSRRTLKPSEASVMVKVREARRAFRKFQSTCFWSYNPSLQISKGDIPWVVEQLRKNGNREAWEVAARLCR